MRWSFVFVLATSACGLVVVPEDEPSIPLTDAGLEVDAGLVGADGGNLDAGLEPLVDAGFVVDAGLTAIDAGARLVVCGASSSLPIDVSLLANGDVARCEVVRSSSGAPLFPGREAFRVVYRTTTLLHADGGSTEIALPASGLVVIPTTTGGDRPVLANTHGTVGVLAACAPSRGPSFDSRIVFDELQVAARDAVVVVPDFVGLGVDSMLRSPDSAHAVNAPTVPFNRLTPMVNVSHPYVSIESEGRATIDLVRAARQLPNAGLGASPRWLVLGVSQGGHAALATGEVWSRGYGAETRLRGVLAGAPGAMFENTAFIENDIERILTPMVLIGASLEHRDVSPARLLTSQALAGFGNTAGRECLSQNTIGRWVTTMNTSLLGVPLLRADPLSDAPTRAALHRNSPGFESTSVPVFIGQATGDPFVDHRRTALLVDLERQTNPGRVTACVFPGESLGQPWLLRVQNHDAFSFMFGQSAASCTDGTGQSTTTTARSFVATHLAAP